jgi:hypothetical protein
VTDCSSVADWYSSEPHGVCSPLGSVDLTQGDIAVTIWETGRNAASKGCLIGIDAFALTPISS